MAANIKEFLFSAEKKDFSTCFDVLMFWYILKRKIVFFCVDSNSIKYFNNRDGGH